MHLFLPYLLNDSQTIQFTQRLIFPNPYFVWWRETAVIDLIFISSSL